MTIEVLGKTYEVLEIIPKKYAEYDLFICKAPAGYKECFQRIDIGREARKIKVADAVPWTLTEINIVNEALKKGVNPKEISKYSELWNHTETAIIHKAITTKREMFFKEQMEQEKKSRPRFNIKF